MHKIKFRSKYIALAVFHSFLTFIFVHPCYSNFLKKDLKVCFTPGEDCTKLIVEELNNANTEILVQAYSLTSAPIAKALVDAFMRGVNVQIILDRSQKTAKYSALSFFIKLGIPTFIDDKHAIAHNKIIIIDSEILMTGSFNFTKAAQERNAENLIIINHFSLIEKYKKNWQLHFRHSKSG